MFARITVIILLALGFTRLACAADNVAVPPAGAPKAGEVKKMGRPDYSALLADMDADGVALHESGVRLDARNFEVDGKNVEAIFFAPPPPDPNVDTFIAVPHPGLLLVPGYGMSARDWVGNGLAFAKAGYSCLAVSQPGFGKTEGPQDFVGPWTMTVLNASVEQLKKMPGVMPDRLGAVGYSRGAMGVSLLVTQRTDLKAAVLGGGVYDFQQAFDDIESNEIKTNMVLETGGSEAGLSEHAAAERSSILYMDKLTASLLILHGDQDKNAPVNQATRLADKLKALGKDYELHLFEGKEHSIGLKEFIGAALDFLGRKL